MIPHAFDHRIPPMPARRLILFCFVALLMLGSFATIGGYSYYLRSPGYRQRCAASLAEKLRLPCEIGAVVPRSRHRRGFKNVVVWLPEKRGRALTCENALVINTPTAGNPEAYEIRLGGGSSEISTRTWLRQDYRSVLESGLRPGFSPDGPRKVTFEKMNLAFVRDRFRAELHDAAGVVSFNEPTAGHAAITCKKLNGYQPERPVTIAADFSPHVSGIRIDQLELNIPDLPLKIARLDQLAGLNLQTGRFNGQLTYEENDDGEVLTISGMCRALELAECTQGLTTPVWQGRCPKIEVQELRVENNSPTRLRFSGALDQVDLGRLLETWGLPGVIGTISFDVGDAQLSKHGIDRFVASGQGIGISLETLSEALGCGTMTGRLDITISDLRIENNILKSMDVSLIVVDATEEANWIEGRLLREIISRTLKINLPPVLPERIEYTRLGAKLEARDEVLYIFGTHGEREKTIMTARLYGNDLPLIFEPRRSFDLGPWFDELRSRASKHLEQLGQQLQPEP